jgi:solute carrier family 25 (mitochondrial oxoglutarate transporter), member 11
VQTLAQEGPLRFYTGFPTYVVRIGPHVAITLVFAAELPKWQKQIGL